MKLRSGITFPDGTTQSTAIPAGTMEGWQAINAQGGAAPAFQNAWINYGAGQLAAAYRKFPDGRVALRGLIKGGTVSATSTGIAFTLPVGYRPASATQRFIVPSSNGTIYTTGSIEIATDGSVYVSSGGNTAVDLSSIEFDTELVSTYLAGQTGPEGPAYNRLPRHHGYKTWSTDPEPLTAGSTLTAGVVRLMKMMVPETITLSSILTVSSTASSAENANTFMGAYVVSGGTATLLAQSAESSAAFRATGLINRPLTTVAGRGLTVTGGVDVFMYWAFLQGTAGTTALNLLRGTTTPGAANGLTTATTGFITATFGTALTALPDTITLSAMAAGQNLYFGAVA